MGLKSLGKLKKELDKWFSLYVRLRNCDENGLTICFTCNKTDHYKKLQNGHFQSRRHNSTRWHPENCQVQCIRCNMFNQGEQFKFSKNIDAKYGNGKAEELEILSKKITKVFREDYNNMITYYKSVVNKIKKQNNLD